MNRLWQQPALVPVSWSNCTRWWYLRSSLRCPQGLAEQCAGKDSSNMPPLLNTITKEAASPGECGSPVSAGTQTRSISEADFGSRMRSWLHMAEGTSEYPGPRQPEKWVQGAFHTKVLNYIFEGNMQHRGHGRTSGTLRERRLRACLPEAHPRVRQGLPGPTFLTSGLSVQKVLCQIIARPWVHCPGMWTAPLLTHFPPGFSW